MLFWDLRYVNSKFFFFITNIICKLYLIISIVLNVLFANIKYIYVQDYDNIIFSSNSGVILVYNYYF